MEEQIIKIEDGNCNGYFRRYIFGLNLLPDDHPQYASIYDPRVIFLRELSRQCLISALTDKGCNHILDSDPLLSHASYTKVPVGILGGEFIRYQSFAEATSLFFPNIGYEFFDFTYSDGDGKVESQILSIMYSDALALFISPSSSDASLHLIELLTSSFSSSEEFIRKAVEIYGIVLTTGADGDFFECFAQEQSRFEPLNKPLDIAVTKIKETSWYREFHNDLVWDDDLSMCLLLKA